MMKTEKLPMIQPVAPAITSNRLDFQWNYAEVKKYLEAITEKYRGLTATEENLPDFEKARREVVHLRTALTKFKADGKRKLKEPADRFAKQCDELIAVVTDVEMPINAQMDLFDEARRERLGEEITTEYQAKASNMGLDMSYWDLQIPSRWYNRTQKWSDTCKEIDQLIKSQLAHQKADEDRAQLIAQKKEILSMTIDKANTDFKLKTPLSAADIFGGFTAEMIESFPLDDLKKKVTEAAERQKAIETAAAQPVEPPPQETGEDPPAENKQEPIENPFSDLIEEQRYNPPKERAYLYELTFDTSMDVSEIIGRFVQEMKIAGVEVNVKKGEF
ncbi:DUF1351 domain-containing protein [Dialister succinatiphilus]|uniref:DUF1351 domain-containing protein n=1 Tax=Dialister succinatiphilus TaxID=487173 RepID=UPI004026C350